MSDENSTSDVGFKCDVNLFFEGVSNANAAKGSVRSTIETANSMADIEGIGRVIAELNNCNIDALIGVIETARDSLLSLDSDFANQYFKLLQTYIKGLDPEALGDEYLAQYIASEKEYWTTLVAMLEKNEDNLNDKMKKQLDIAREMASYYDITDDMGASNITTDELEKLYGRREECEKRLLELNGLSGEALDKAIAELEQKYDIAVLSIKYNETYKQMLSLDINDENYRDSAISLLEEQAEYQRQLIDLNTDLTDEEKAQLKAEINRKLVENKDVVRLNAVSNEFNNLDITAADYEEKSKSLLDLQKYYTKKIYRSDKSLTPEQLAKKLDEVDSQYESIYLAVESAKIQSDLDILNAKIEEYEKDPKGYKNDPKNSGEDPDKYEETRLTLLNNFRGCTEEQLKLAGLTQIEINDQLAAINAEIYQAQQNNEWKNMSIGEKIDQYTGTFILSVGAGILDVGENIFDGMAMLYGKVFDKEEEVAELVKADFSENAYASWVNACGINTNAAYSAAHTIGTMAGSAIGYSLITVATGGLGAGTIAAVATTALVGGLAAGGSASERALNSGATFDQAFSVGTGAFALGAASGMLSGALTAGMPSSINMIGGPLSLNNTLNSTIATIGKYAIVGGVIGAVEPAINPIIEYNVYAKNLKDEDGNSLYNSLGDYYAESGAFTNILIGFGSGAVSAVRDYRQAERDFIHKSTFKSKNKDIEIETEAYKQGDLLGDGLDAPTAKSPDIATGTYDLNGQPIYFMGPDDLGTGYDFGVRNKVSISDDVKSEALSSFQDVMKTGAPSNQAAIDVFYDAFKEGLDNGDEEALKVIRRITEIKQKNPNFTITPYKGRSCWNDLSSTIFFNVDEPISKGMLCHELGHALFDTGLNGELPDNWSSILREARDSINKDPGRKITILSEIWSAKPAIKAKAEQEVLKYLPFDTIDDFENQLTKQYEKILEKSPYEIAESLRKQNYDWETINNVINGGYSARDLAKISIKSEVNGFFTKILQTQYEDISAISDIYDAVYDGKPYDSGRWFTGHGSSYYKKAYALGCNNLAFHEIIANFTQLKLTGNDKYLYSVKYLYGDTFYKTLEDTFNNMILGNLT